MKKKLFPQRLTDITIALYRFMCRGFGKKVPKPYYGNFCGPFWTVFFTYFVPVLTLFVLMAVVARFLLGQRRGEIMGSKVVSSSSWMVATKTRAAMGSAMLWGLAAIPIVLFWSIAWPVLAGVGAVIGLLLLLVAIIMALNWLDDRGNLDFLANFSDKISGFWNALPKPVRWTIIGILAVAFSPVILAFAVVIGLIYGAYFFYENACPIVRESYSSS